MWTAMLPTRGCGAMCHHKSHELTSYVRGPIQSSRAEFWWWPHGMLWPGFSVWRRLDARRPRRRDGNGSSLCSGIAASSLRCGNPVERLDMSGGYTHTGTWYKVIWGYHQSKLIWAVRHKINIKIITFSSAVGDVWRETGPESIPRIVASYFWTVLIMPEADDEKNGSYCCGYHRQVWTPGL